mgnify:FL=1
MTDAIDLDVMWDSVIESADAPTRAWLRRTKPIAMHGSTMMLAVSDEPTRERIETRLRVALEEQLSDHFNTPTHLAVMIDPDQVPEQRPAAAEVDEEVASQLPEPILAKPRPQSDVRLNPRYTFESFVAGSSNRFAHAAAAAVAETPGKAYNLSLIHI